MGSFSVYCGISKITITAGTDCILLPLIKVEENMDEQKYFPYTLPIFGKYNDYGGIENIVEDFNTKLIEETFKCSIQSFCNIILGDDVDEDDEEFENEEFENEEFKNVTYMWIHGDVYKFIAQEFRPVTYRRAENFEMGNPLILKKLGFVEAGEYDDKRFNKLFTYNDVKICSDGTWAHYINPTTLQQEGIYNLSNLKKILPELDVSYFENKEQSDLFELFDYKKRYNELYFSLGFSRDLLFWKDAIKIAYNQHDPTIEKYAKTNKMQDVYLPLFNDNHFCQIMSDIRRMILNCRYFSTQFEPFVQFITPQFGEAELYDKILQKFTSINQKHCTED